MSIPTLNNSFSLDTSILDAFMSMLESKWEFSSYGVEREIIIKCTADDIFDYYINTYKNINYKVFYGNRIVMWTDNFIVSFRGNLMDNQNKAVKIFNDEIIITGEYQTVRDVVNNFDKAFESLIIPPHNRVSMVIKGEHGLEKINLPIKTSRTFYPEMYPIIDNCNEFIKGFLNSTANVLILMGPAGLGKSALINEIILKAGLPTQIVFDEDVMRNERLYTSFISTALDNGGGLMVMEDSDNILRDREVFNNDMMSKLLNLSDGIVDTAGAKFIFSANIQNKEQVDSALVRPGRCYDVVEFRNLTREEAETAAKAIGVDLYAEKPDYTVAEIFNSKTNRKEKRKVGFI